MGRRRARRVEVVVGLEGEGVVAAGMARGDVVGEVDVGVLARRVERRERLLGHRQRFRRLGLRALEQWDDCCRDLKK